MSSEEIKVHEALTPFEIDACWPVLQALRPHLIHGEFLDRVLQQQQDEGYRLMFIQDSENTPVSICGFRIQNYLWCGKTCFIDDVCTLSTAQGKGYAGRLLDFVSEFAVQQNCDSIFLHSGYTRNDAHRFYLNKGFELKSHYFHKHLK